MATTIMMLSSVGRGGDAQRCKELGVAAYLTKPVRQSVLLDAMRTVLARCDQPRKVAAPVTPHRVERTDHPLLVLLVEDNPVNTLVAVKTLEKRGHSVVSAADGREAIESLSRSPFDVVLMDIQMTGMDGLDATAKIRHREQGTGRHVRIVGLTAYAQREDRERCLAAGMDAFLSKPYSAADLFAVVESAPPAGTRSTAAVPDRSVFDAVALLDRLGADRSLFDEVIGVFRRECPRLLGELRDSLRSRSATSLAFCAHALSGALSAVCADRAGAAASKLEEMGRHGDLTGVDHAGAALEAELETLRPVLIAAAGGEA